jgi:hypothetical protein
MIRTKNISGLVGGIRFEIKNSDTINVWKPTDIEITQFKDKCNLIVKYLIDEGLFNKKKCKVNIIT